MNDIIGGSSSQGKTKGKSAMMLLTALIILGSAMILPMSTQVQQASATQATCVYIDPQTAVKGTQVTIRGYISHTICPISTFDPSLNGQQVNVTLTDLANPLNVIELGTWSTETDYGDFKVTFTAPAEAAYWKVTAKYAGDITFSQSTGEGIFATVEPGALVVGVANDGLPHQNVNLSLTDLGFAFGASLNLEYVPEDYTAAPYPINATVAQCVSPGTSSQSRFLPLSFDTPGNSGSICLELFPGPIQQVGNTPEIKATISYAGVQTLPNGYSESDIDLFYQNVKTGEIKEITASRNVQTKEITGNATDSGRFIVGIGLHGAPSAGNIRQHVFVGDGQPAMFRNINDMSNSTTPDISISPDEIALEEPFTITMNYSNGNIDVNAIDTLSVQINSTSSTPDHVTIQFTETSADSGIFTAQLTLTEGATSGSSLHASQDDHLTFNIVNKAPTDARFRATLDRVSEAGVVELGDRGLTDDELTDLIANQPFVPVVGLANIALVDATVDGSAGKVHITMSYANALLGSGNPSNLVIYHRPATSGLIQESWDTDHAPVPTVDTANKLVSATFDITSPVGIFALGFPDGALPGGAGGGLGKPGIGVVLDFIAPFREPSPPPSPPPPDNSNNNSSPPSTPTTTSSSHSSRSSSAPTSTSTTGTSQISQGDNVQTTFTSKEGNLIKVTFETIASGGTLTMTEKSVSDYSSIIDSVLSPTSGTISVGGGSQYHTTGSVFDIDASKIAFNGDVDVTIPYNESLLLASEISESDVRFLHYDGSQWEDATVSFDTGANTVTGRVSSLSPVVAAVSVNGTFGPAYFKLHPLSKVDVMNTALLATSAAGGGNSIIATTSTNGTTTTVPEIQSGQQLVVSNILKNFQNTNQNYAVIFQVLHPKGYVQSLSWQTGVLKAGQSAQVSDNGSGWIASEPGTYTIQIFVWDNVYNNPYPLSAATVQKIVVK